jgi:DNA-binding NtrC family response regulator
VQADPPSGSDSFHKNVARPVGAKILVVEDEVLISLHLEMILREMGCVCLGPCASIAEALAALELKRPDAVLLDIELADGRATLVAQALASQSIPFAVLTGQAKADLEGALANPPILSKPFSVCAVQSMVLRLLAPIGR